MRLNRDFTTPWMEDEEDRLWNSADLDLIEDSDSDDEDDLDDDLEGDLEGEGEYEFTGSDWREFATSRHDNDDYMDDGEPEWKSSPRRDSWSDDPAAYLEKPSRQNRGRHGRKRFSDQRRRR